MTFFLNVVVVDSQPRSPAGLVACHVAANSLRKGGLGSAHRRRAHSRWRECGYVRGNGLPWPSRLTDGYGSTEVLRLTDCTNYSVNKYEVRSGLYYTVLS
jgi:hypothetical protein